MALNPGLRSPSSASSEGSPRRRRGGPRFHDESLTTNKAFRRYTAGIDRALGLFDTTLQEWADYISFLSRLLKALHSHPEGVTVVPRKHLVAKRLAQCLHPSLPSGVHQKAFEVYTFIFRLIGQDGLADDLATYLTGIASTLTFASISVRPVFLSLIEDYILKIPTCALRPALKALILALLPGLEEENSDEFEQTLKTLTRCKHAFSSAGLVELFWQNLFLASITSSSRRHGVLVYLSRYLPKLGEGVADPFASVEDEASRSVEIAALTTPEPGLLLRCFATGLADEQVLVQRAFLDLLTTHLPLHASIFHQNVPANDLRLLTGAAVGVVLRRDMSLNRRLWSWFLGPESVQIPKGESVDSSPKRLSKLQSRNGVGLSDVPSYFQAFGVQPLIQSLEAMISNDSREPSKVSRPFRIALSLMDRWEIGSPVVNAIFLPLFRTLRAYQQSATLREDFEEVFRSANMFFDGVESNLIWSKILNLVIFTGKAKEDVLRDLDLATFLIANFNVREEDMVMVHIPLVSLTMLEQLSQGEEPGSNSASTLQDGQVQSTMFHLLSLMIDLIPERAFAPRSSAAPKPSTPVAKDIKVNGIQEYVQSFFDHSQDAVELSELPFSPKTLGKHFLQLLMPMILRNINNDTSGSDLSRHVQILSILLDRLHSCDGLEGSILVEALRNRLAIKHSFNADLPFALISSATALFASFFVGSQDQLIQSDDISTIVPMLVQHLWSYLSPRSPQYHIETVHLLEDLQYIFWQEELVTSTILHLLVGADADLDDNYHPSKEALTRYAILWTYSRDNFGSIAKSNSEPLTSSRGSQRKAAAAFSSMLRHSMISILSVLREPQTEVYAACRDWLQSLADLSSIFEAVITPIRKSLGLDNNTHISKDNVGASSDLIEVLNRLLATQSNEQRHRFTRPPGSVAHHHLDSKARGPEAKSLQVRITALCCEIIQLHELRDETATDRQMLRLQRVTLSLLRELFCNFPNEPLFELHVDQLLVAQLDRSVVLGSRLLQSDFLDTLLLILKSKITARSSQDAKLGLPSEVGGQRQTRTKVNSTSPLSSRNMLSRPNLGHSSLLNPPKELLNCFLKGIGNASSQDLIQRWVELVCESTYLYTSSTFSILMKVVECFCKEIELCFGGMKAQYEKGSSLEGDFEGPLSQLLNGLDFLLARAHEQLLSDEESLSALNSPEAQQGFFEHIVSGALPSDNRQARNNTNNNRLTVILCFQDALRACFRLWSWQSLNTAQSSYTLASFSHASQKIRGRSRRILEHLLAAEPLEAIETLAQIWVRANGERNTIETESLLGLVHTLEGSRPGITMTALFNAIYSRTNPAALVPRQKSTLSTNLQEFDLVSFMCTYARSLEDDVLEEIWKDCTSFLHDVLGNPMPHRQILTRLINFIAILSAKMENTNFGEERTMRRELADLFVRLLTAIFTIKPQNSSREKTAKSSVQSDGTEFDSVEQILDQSFATFSALLDESDRLVAVIVNVVSNIIAPRFRSRQFPQNLTSPTLSLLLKISSIQNASKAWRKELADPFNDPKFFSSPLRIVEDGWLPLLRQLALSEKALLPELLSRLSPPTGAGIMFGVGATAARLEADRKAQLNLRRMACLLLSVEYDTVMAHLGLLQAKLEELLTASSVSSPSSITRAEIYMVIRALVLISSTGQMASFWPMVITELRAAFSSLYDGNEDPSSRTYSKYSLLQAAKLLDVLLLTNLEDFQPQEWFFVTDTVDAIYRPGDWEPGALIDELAQSSMENVDLSKSPGTPLAVGNTLAGLAEEDRSFRRPWLSGEQTRALAEADIPRGLLRPFFGQLSIYVYERIYSLSDADMGACKADLLADLFNEHTIVGS